MAKKSKAKQSKKVNAAKLPAGFTAIAVGGGFGAWHDFSKARVLVGKVTGFDSYQQENEKTGKKETRRVMRVDTGKTTVSVGESFALKELFDTPKLKGRTVYIEFLGQKTFKNKKGQARKVNQFAAGVK